MGPWLVAVAESVPSLLHMDPIYQLPRDLTFYCEKYFKYEKMWRMHDEFSCTHPPPIYNFQLSASQSYYMPASTSFPSPASGSIVRQFQDKLFHVEILQYEPSKDKDSLVKQTCL